ncbi:hypothetical protein DM868_10745 [Natronomonas salsuginis]|uniref:NodB homology domain-containing protein n=2 Tax=Natronomonas salsuginis TaxID=2217661 RepID=A0A4U5J824_9EURY|nr:hypothetical protein DM868_10745 [Natronomonas salsuginis]
MLDDIDLDSKVPDFGYSPFNRSETLYRPVLDPERESPTWPGDASFAVCLTHDVDTVTEHSIRQTYRRLVNTARCREQLSLDAYVQKVSESFLRLGYDTIKSLQLGSDPLHQYERWLNIESSVKGTSTFFFIADERTARHHTDTHYSFSDTVVFDQETMTVGEMIREIDDRGWEIGLHPTWPSYDDPKELERQKSRLESVLDHEVKSVRQHFLHYDIGQTPRAHADAGFQYDSTLGFNDNVGFRFGTSYPWQLYDLEAEESLPLIEIPLVIQDNALLNQSKGLRLDVETAFEYVKQIAAEVKSVGGVLTLLWHPSSISNREWRSLYTRVLEYLKEEGAWFGSVREIGEHWKQQSDVFSAGAKPDRR